MSDTAELIAAILAGEDPAEACQRISARKETAAARAEYEEAKANLADLYELRAEGGFQNPVGKRRFPEMEAKATARVEAARQRLVELGEDSA